MLAGIQPLAGDVIPNFLSLLAISPDNRINPHHAFYPGEFFQFFERVNRQIQADNRTIFYSSVSLVMVTPDIHAILNITDLPNFY